MGIFGGSFDPPTIAHLQVNWDLSDRRRSIELAGNGANLGDSLRQESR